MATKVWKGFLNFGLLSVPVYLNTCARDSHIGLTNLHRGCDARLKMPKICEKCGKTPKPEDIMKGYDTGNGYIELTAAELEAVQPATEKIMEISECPKWADVDPTLLAESFYLLPDVAGTKAYSLLVQALKNSGRVAIAQLTKNNREHVVLLRPKDNGLIAHFLFYSNEVNQVPEFNALKAAKLDASELKLAAKLVDSMATNFDHEQFENGYEMRLNALISSKIDKTAPPPPIQTKAPVQMDVMAALQASLERPRRRITLDDDDVAPKATKKRKVA